MSKFNTNCSVFGCHSRKGKDRRIHFHQFPPENCNITVKFVDKLGQEKRIDKRTAWKIALSIDKPVSESFRVCSKHFRTVDYCSRGVCLNQPKLLRNAVPSQNLPLEIFESQVPSSSNLQEFNEQLDIKPKIRGDVQSSGKDEAKPSLLIFKSEEETVEIDSHNVEDQMHNVKNETQAYIDVEYMKPSSKSFEPLIKNVKTSQIPSSSKESDFDVLKRKMDQLQNENALLKEKMSKYEIYEKNLTTKMNNLDQQLENNESEFWEKALVGLNNGTKSGNMPGCAAVGCPNSAKKGFAMERFPKDPKRRQEWADRLNRSEWSPTDWSTLCEVHFRPEMWEKVRGDGSKKLKHDAVPTIFNAGSKRKVPSKHEPQSPCFSLKSETSDQAENMKFGTNSSIAGISSLKMNSELSVSHMKESIPKSPESMSKKGEPLNDAMEISNNLIVEPKSPITSTSMECRICLETNAKTTSFLQLNVDEDWNMDSVLREVLGETSEQIYDSKMPQQICDNCLYQLDYAYNFKKTYENTLQIVEHSLSKERKEEYHTLCRICLDPGAELPFASELTLDDESTLNILEIFQVLTGETSEQIYDSKMPQRICLKCPESLLYAYQFKKSYENSTQILGDSLSKTESICETTDSALVEDDVEEEYSEDLSETEDNLANNETQNEINKIEEKQIKLHSCPICFEKFSALELKQHCQSHDSLKSYFVMAPLYNKKIRFYAKPKNNICLFYRETVLHTCPFCLNAFVGKNFRNHVKTHKTDGNFKCKLCDRKFLGRNHLKMHQLMHRKETPFNCEVCGKGFFLKKNFDFHQFHHLTPEQLPFQCEHCSKSFANPEHLKRHNFTHQKSMNYKKYYPNKQNFSTCKHCKQKFKTEKELGEHKCTFICPKCVKPFTNKKKLLGHGCKVERLRYTCTCGKEFRSFSTCKLHTCKKRRPKTICSVCGKGVANLTLHLRSHYPETRVDAYICDTCGKNFKYKESVWRHKKAVHKPSATFNCQYCDKQFGNKIYMKNHESIHTRKKDHICEICGLTFLYKVYLTRHQKVHKNTTTETTESEEDSPIVLSN